MELILGLRMDQSARLGHLNPRPPRNAIGLPFVLPIMHAVTLEVQIFNTFTGKRRRPYATGRVRPIHTTSIFGHGVQLEPQVGTVRTSTRQHVHVYASQPQNVNLASSSTPPASMQYKPRRSGSNNWRKNAT